MFYLIFACWVLFMLVKEKEYDALGTIVAIIGVILILGFLGMIFGS